MKCCICKVKINILNLLFNKDKCKYCDWASIEIEKEEFEKRRYELMKRENKLMMLSRKLIFDSQKKEGDEK